VYEIAGSKKRVCEFNIQPSQHSFRNQNENMSYVSQFAFPPPVQKLKSRPRKKEAFRLTSREKSMWVIKARNCSSLYIDN